MAAGDLYKGVFTMLFGGVTMQNVLFFTAKVGGVDAEHLTLQMAGDWPSSWAYWTCDEAQMVSYYAQKMNTLSAEAFTRPVTIPTFGAAGSGGAPLTSAVVITLRTGFYGRSARGRIFLGAYPLSFLTLGVLNSGGLGNINARWGIWHDKYGSGGSNPYWQMGVYSRVVGGYTIPYDPVGFLPYTEFIVNVKTGTERGRKT